MIRKIILVTIIAFAVFQLIYSNRLSSLYFDSIPIGVETILVLIFSIYFLFEEINNPNIIFLYNNYRFWIIVGFMIYLAGSFFIYILANFLSRPQLLFYWQFIDVFLILKNIFFTIGILVFALQSKFTNQYFTDFHQNSFPKP